VPGSISVVTGDEIRARGATDLRAALALLGGVSVAPGITNSSVAIMPANERDAGMMNTSLDPARIDRGRIKRLESSSRLSSTLPPELVAEASRRLGGAIAQTPHGVGTGLGTERVHRSVLR